MSSATAEPQRPDAWAYERYIRENWDRLTPYQQEEARAYLQAKFQRPTPAAATAAGWPVPLGYVCAFVAILFVPIILAPFAFGCGVYNASKGRTGHGVAQIILSIVCGLLGFALGALVWAYQ
jgi:hypothetical protein